MLNNLKDILVGNAGLELLEKEAEALRRWRKYQDLKELALLLDLNEGDLHEGDLEADDEVDEVDEDAKMDLDDFYRGEEEEEEGFAKRALEKVDKEVGCFSQL